MSAADGGGGSAARAMHDDVATPLDLIAAKEKVTGRGRVSLRVVEPDEDLDAAHAEGEAREPTVRKRARHGIRAKTISIKRMSKRELERGRMMFPETEYERPVTRGDCQYGAFTERPCAFVGCKHHLYLDVNPNGNIKVNFPDLEVWDLRETCALDIADRGGITLEEVGEITNLTRERVRQLETRGLAKLKLLAELGNLSDWIDVDRGLSRRQYVSPTHDHDGEGDDDPTSHGLTSEAVETVERVEEGSYDPIAHGVGLASFLR